MQLYLLPSHLSKLYLYLIKLEHYLYHYNYSNNKDENYNVIKGGKGLGPKEKFEI